HALADYRRAVTRHPTLELVGGQRGELDLQVDAVEGRERQPAQVAIALGRRADARLQRGTAAPARVGGGDQLKARREVADPARASYRDPAVLQRLTQRLEHVLLELGQLVEEEHPTVGERHLAGMGGAGAADEPRGGARAMRRGGRALGHEPAAWAEQAGHRPDRRDLNDLVVVE